MKKCEECNNIKPLDEFFLRKDSGRYRPKCKLCMANDNTIYRRNNKDLVKIISHKSEQKNKEKNKITKSKYRKNNRKKCNALAAKYRASKLNATLEGFDEEIKNIYLNSPKGNDVHHKIPLVEHNDKVSGLHVPWNLESLTKEEHYEAHKKLRKTFGIKSSV